MADLSTFTVGQTTYNIKDTTARGLLGTKVTGTVSGNTLAFTNSKISNNVEIDGPYVQNNLIGLESVVFNGTTVTYTLENETADGASAYIWVGRE